MSETVTSTSVPRKEGRTFLSLRARRSITTGIAIVVLWELIGRYVLNNPLFFVPLSSVFAEGVKLWSEGKLQEHILASGLELAVGLFFAITVGAVIGVALGFSRRIRDYAENYVVALYATPLLALAPLIILWLGLGITSKIVIVFAMAVFPIIINTSAGVRATEAVFMDVANAFGATRKQTLQLVIVPSAVPYFLAGLRLAVGRGVVAVVVGELFGAQAGLGYLIYVSSHTFNVAAMFVGILILSASGVGLTFLVELAERRVLNWRKSVLED